MLGAFVGCEYETRDKCGDCFETKREVSKQQSSRRLLGSSLYLDYLDMPVTEFAPYVPWHLKAALKSQTGFDMDNHQVSSFTSGTVKKVVEYRQLSARGTLEQNKAHQQARSYLNKRSLQSETTAIQTTGGASEQFVCDNEKIEDADQGWRFENDNAMGCWHGYGKLFVCTSGREQYIFLFLVKWFDLLLFLDKFTTLLL